VRNRGGILAKPGLVSKRRHPTTMRTYLQGERRVREPAALRQRPRTLDVRPSLPGRDRRQPARVGARAERAVAAAAAASEGRVSRGAGIYIYIWPIYIYGRTLAQSRWLT
jgi:hypothetical protein